MKNWGHFMLKVNQKSGRELTAENCAACAIEENEDRVKELKQTENVKFE